MPYVQYTKMGKKVNINLNTPLEYKVSRKQYEPLPAERIIGIDTESPTRSGNPVLKYLQLSSVEKESIYDLEETGRSGLDHLFCFLIEQYGQTYDNESRVKQRRKVTGRKSRTGRDGRRKKVQPVVLAFFNLEYDLGRLITDQPIFRRVIAYGADSFRFPWGEYTIEIVYNCLGVACPSFQWYIYHPDTKRVVRIVGFDSSNYFKGTLKAVAKQLNTPTQKMHIDSDIFVRDWDHLDETPSKAELADFIEYSLVDARVHREVYLAIVAVLRDIDVCIIDQKGCIPSSAPSAAAKVMQHFSSQDSYLPPPLWVQQQGLNAYKGAISFCSHPGYHHNIAVVDISSAYPHCMSLLPDYCTVEYKRVKPGVYNQKKYKGKWGVLVVSGESFDDIYPPLVEYREGKQKGVYGPFHQFTATIPEIVIGVARGALRIDVIHDGFIMLGEAKQSGLRKFILEMYRIKSESEKNGPLYLMAKLLMNSLYGKFIEKRHKFSTVPNIDENGNHLTVMDVPDPALKKQVKNIWQLYGYEAVEAVLSNHCQETGETYPQISLNAYLSEDSYESGRYFNAAYASQITGFTRAKLMGAASYLGAYQGDTDSLFIDYAKIDGVRWEGFLSYLNSIGAMTPGDGLGSFENETVIKEALPSGEVITKPIACTGLFVKKKVYFLEYNGKIKKMGHHGFSGIAGREGEISPEEMTRILIEQYYKYGTLEYTTKKRPLRLKQSLRGGGIIGKFEAKTIRLTLVSSEYQTMDENGWLHWQYGG